MSESTIDPAPKKALPSAAVLTMTAGAGVASGGLLDEQLSDIIQDLSIRFGWDWLAHPTSWAGALIGLGGLLFHLYTKSQVKGN